MKPGMLFADRLQTMCDSMFVPNPIQEEDLEIDSISFHMMNGEIRRIAGSDINRAGRLFFQFLIANIRDEVCTTITESALDRLKKKAEKFFGERWHDAEEKGRIFLESFQKADLIIIHWKESSNA